MPPRYAYWTILIDSKPTAFRAREQEELLPTLTQLRRTNSDVVMKWFARGRLWDSPEAEREAQKRPPAAAEKRAGDWRPGGAHKDPRDRFKKKNRPPPWSGKGASVQRDRDKLGPPRDKPVDAPRSDRPWSKPPSGGAPRGDRPWNKPPAGAPRSDRPWSKPPAGAPRSDRPWSKPPSGAPRGDRPWSSKPPPGGDRPWGGKPPSGGPPRRDRPWSSKPPTGGPPRGERPWTKSAKPPASGAPRGDRPWTNPNRPPSGAPRGDRPWTDKPRATPQGAAKPWRDKPAGRPQGDRQWQNKARGSRPFTPQGQRPPRKRRDDDPDKS
jgi:23S rRNA pseudouridine2605 synthase